MYNFLFYVKRGTIHIRGVRTVTRRTGHGTLLAFLTGGKASRIALVYLHRTRRLFLQSPYVAANIALVT